MRKSDQRFPTMHQLRQSGVGKRIKRIDANPDATWEDRALVRVAIYPRFNALFLCEDIAEWASRETGLPEAPEPRAWGAVMQRAERNGWIEATDSFAHTQYGKGHRKPMRLWTAGDTTA